LPPSRCACRARPAQRRRCCIARPPTVPRETIRDPGPATEAKTGRKYFLDYPCGLKKGDKVTFILSLHGAGSIGKLAAHYFPLLDYKDKYRLVIATPFSPTTTWSSADDAYLQNIVTAVTNELGGENVKGVLARSATRRAARHRAVWCAPISSRTRSTAS
jgi:hypothetical protein